MLKSWSIKNFKPIVDSGELQLAPVTVLAGRNSSGKSSLLQSILMIAQTLSNRVLDRPLITNGLFIQLGTFENVLNENSHSNKIDISFSLDFYDHAPKFRWSKSPIASTEINVVFIGNSNTSISASITPNVFIDRIQLNIILNAYQFAFNFEEPDKPHKENIKINFQAKLLSSAKKQEFLKNVREDFYDLLSDANNYLGDFYYSQSNRTEGPYLIEFAHFLPEHFIEKYNVMEQQKLTIEQSVAEILQIDNSGLNISDTFSLLITPISDALYEELTDCCQELSISEVFNGDTMGDLARWYQSLQWTSESEKIAFGQQLQDIVVPYLLSEDYEGNNDLTEDTEGLKKIAPDLFFEKAIEQITHFFTSSARYLGPLRADPGTIQQQFAPTGELDYVGIKGEYAAIVYHTNKNALIDWYNLHTQQIENGTLQSALDIWAHYLNIAERIGTEEAGAIGITWRIVPKKGLKPRSLPEVGVGISQILPILVMGLLSPINTLLIIEQPELHLHPYVQARLGDFFMGLAKCKKQCLIETHSENLVGQLRLHIVQAGGLEQSDCMVYFVDQDEKGAAKFEKVEISPNGNILNWPDGFFDETMLQEDRITAASLRKRAQKTQRG